MFALPRFAVSNGASCIACHVNPTGSAMRNSHGNDVVSLEELPLKRWMNKGDDNWDGHVTEQIQLGGDFRLQGVQYNDTNETQKSAFFPMQADIYVNLKLNDNSSIFTKVGVKSSSSLNMEYWAMIQNLPLKSWLRMGRTLPNYGMRVDDHTSFIRGGNINKTKVGLNEEDLTESEGLLFEPYLVPPTILEIGIPLTKKLEWTNSFSTSLINDGQYNEMTNFTSKLTHIGSLGDIIRCRTSLSYMQEGDFNMIGTSGGISIGNHVWTFAFDQAENWIGDATSIAIYNEIAWELMQGIQIIGKHDYFDPRTKWNDGSISRYVIGFEIYPLNVMEIKIQTRFSEVSMENMTTKKDPEYLIQTHFYF